MNPPYDYRNIDGKKPWAVVSGHCVVGTENSRNRASSIATLLNNAWTEGRMSATNPDLAAERAEAYKRGYNQALRDQLNEAAEKEDAADALLEEIVLAHDAFAEDPKKLHRVNAALTAARGYLKDEKLAEVVA